MPRKPATMNMSRSTQTGLILAPRRAERPRRRRLHVGVGALAATLAAAGATTIVRACRPSTLAPSVPLDRIAPTTISISTIPLHGAPSPGGKGRPEIVASKLAALSCQGFDVAGTLIRAKGRGYREAASLGLEALAEPTSIREALRCGAGVAGSLGELRTIRLAAEDNGVQRSILALPHAQPIPELPGLISATFGSMAGRCTPAIHPGAAPAESTCAAHGQAAFGDGGLWYTGAYEDISYFATAYRRQGALKADEPVATLARLVRASAPADAWEVRFRPPAVDLSLPCAAVAPADALNEFMSGCLPPRSAEDGRAIAVDLRASAVLRDVPEHSGRVRFEYVLWARDPETASSIRRRLADHLFAWRSLLHRNGASLLQAAGTSREPTHARWRAIARTWLAAALGASVERDGELVRLRVESQLTEDDQAALRLAAGDDDDSARAADIVGALMEGRPVEPDALAHFVGKASADWLLAQAVTVQDCLAVAEHAKQFEGRAGFLPGDFLLMTEIIEAWGARIVQSADGGTRVGQVDERVCRAKRLSPVARSCLLGAASVRDMVACDIPIPPEVARVQDRLQGTFRAIDVAGASPYQRTSLMSQYGDTTLSVHGSRVLLSGGYDSMQGDLRILSLRRDEGDRTGGALDARVLTRFQVGDRRIQITMEPEAKTSTPEEIVISTWNQHTGAPMPLLRMRKEVTATTAQPQRSIENR